MRIRHWSWCLIAGTLSLSGLGCGNRLVTVKGVATLDGKPLEGATITFIQAGGAGRPAMTVSNSDGAFSMYASPGSRSGEGVWPGTYKVTVERAGYPSFGMPGGLQPPDGLVSDIELERWAAKAHAEQKKKPSPWAKIPMKYKKVDTTPFEFKVPTNGPIRLDLTSEGKS
jgi:hypothetical protein